MKKTLLLPLSLFILSSCSTVYYKSWELLGQEKRDLLKSNLNELNEDQEEAKEEFSSVLEKIRKQYNFKEGDLESTYDDVNSDYKELEEEVQDVTTRLSKVRDIASDLFDEWREEANSFNNKTYRQNSFKKLKKTKSEFNKVLKVTTSVEKKMQRTLSKYREQVLYIKHNLNAKIIGNLTIELKSLQREMSSIITNIDKSIGQSKSFLKTLN